MTEKQCPVCKGKCCRDHLNYRLTHMGDEFYEHVCDACVDGTEYVRPRTAEDERADVLAWLKRQGGRAAWTLIPEIAQGRHVGAAQQE